MSNTFGRPLRRSASSLITHSLFKNFTHYTKRPLVLPLVAQPSPRLEAEETEPPLAIFLTLPPFFMPPAIVGIGILPLVRDGGAG